MKFSCVNSDKNENENKQPFFSTALTFRFSSLFNPLKFGPTKVKNYGKYHVCAFYSSIGILENELCIWEEASKTFSFEHP